jgi:MoaA/NifB/PqqE/SkfB family radical SAM enzyme
MPNVLLTYSCNRTCPYCFAQEVLGRTGPAEPLFIPWENLVVVADYLEAAGHRDFAALGGEPTLHPEFVNVYRYVLARGFRFKMFSTAAPAPSS